MDIEKELQEIAEGKDKDYVFYSFFKDGNFYAEQIKRGVKPDKVVPIIDAITVVRKFKIETAKQIFEELEKFCWVKREELTINHRNLQKKELDKIKAKFLQEKMQRLEDE